MTDASIATTRSAYKAGLTRDGWCCVLCHAAHFPPSRTGFAELLIHRVVSHRAVPLVRFSGETCHLTLTHTTVRVPQQWVFTGSVVWNQPGDPS